VVVCPYNEPELARTLIRKHAAELAAVIVEPVLGSMGMIPATTEFLRALRDASAENDVLLIFDEVITLRVSDGGAQALCGVTPTSRRWARSSVEVCRSAHSAAAPI
jgi:glutamate-1-semialdehyde 2,1-aminomutase